MGYYICAAVIIALLIVLWVIIRRRRYSYLVLYDGPPIKLEPGESVTFLINIEGDI